MFEKQRGGTPHIPIEVIRSDVQTRVGTPHKISVQENPYGGWVVLSGNNTTSWLHLASWNLPDSQLFLQSKTEPSVAKAPNYIGGDTAHFNLGHLVRCSN